MRHYTYLITHFCLAFTNYELFNYCQTVKKMICVRYKDHEANKPVDSNNRGKFKQMEWRQLH